MRRRIWLVTAYALLIAAPASWADPQRTSPAQPSAPPCAHASELAAAKRALEHGNREAALRHLAQADRILARCEERELLEGGDAPEEIAVGALGSAPLGRLLDGSRPS